MNGLLIDKLIFDEIKSLFCDETLSIEERIMIAKGFIDKYFNFSDVGGKSIFILTLLGRLLYLFLTKRDDPSELLQRILKILTAEGKLSPGMLRLILRRVIYKLLRISHYIV